LQRAGLLLPLDMALLLAIVSDNKQGCIIRGSKFGDSVAPKVYWSYGGN